MSIKSRSYIIIDIGSYVMLTLVELDLQMKMSRIGLNVQMILIDGEKRIHVEVLNENTYEKRN